MSTRTGLFFLLFFPFFFSFVLFFTVGNSIIGMPRFTLALYLGVLALYLGLWQFTLLYLDALT
jgi:hypothetical protein